MHKATKALVLFLCAMAAVAMSVLPAAAYPRGHGEIRRVSPPNWGLLPPLIDIDPEAWACWAALKRVTSCVEGIVGLLFSELDVSLSAECCQAIQRGGGSCFRKIFPRGPSDVPLSEVVQSLSSYAAAPTPQ